MIGIILACRATISLVQWVGHLERQVASGAARRRRDDMLVLETQYKLSQER